jgi:hypothetical protein
MLKHVMTLLLSFGYLTISSAQSVVNHQKEWSPKCLTWDDFQAEPDPTLSNSSVFAYNIRQRTEKIDLRDTVVSFTRIYAVMSQYASWVEPEGRTDDNLFYNQTLFDLVALSTQKLQLEWNHISIWPYSNLYLGQSNIFMPLPLKALEERLQLFQTETQNGTNKAAVLKWSKMIQTEFQKISNQLIINHLNPVKKYFTMYLGVSSNILQGNMRPYFLPSLVGMSFGIDLLRNRHCLTMDVGLGTTHLKKTLDDNGILRPKGLSVNHLYWQTTYGYTLWNGRKWHITPYVGLGMLNLKETVEQNAVPNPNRMQKEQFNLIGGLCVDYILAKKINLSNHYYEEYALKTRFAAMNLNYQPNLQGLSYMNSIGICMTFGFLTNTPRKRWF